MTRAADTPHPHPLSPADLPACPDCHLPIQGVTAGLAVHYRTVHTSAGDPRCRITIHL